MRHNKKINHLGRKTAHRQAMLSNMAASLILHQRIDTTLAKAKALRIYVEPLITKSKDDTTHSRRIVFSYLQNKEAVTELFRNVSSKVGDRPGGYTRILRTGNRLGDNAEMCLMELVDFNEIMLAAKDETKKVKKGRSRRGTSKKTKETAVEPATPKAAKTTATPKTAKAPAPKSAKVPAPKTTKATAPKTTKATAPKTTKATAPKATKAPASKAPKSSKTSDEKASEE
jgi:large subunit ribosomal protein L17